MAPIELFYLRKMSLGVCWYPCHFTEFVLVVLFLICEYYNYYFHY